MYIFIYYYSKIVLCVIIGSCPFLKSERLNFEIDLAPHVFKGWVVDPQGNDTQRNLLVFILIVLFCCFICIKLMNVFWL